MGPPGSASVIAMPATIGERKNGRPLLLGEIGLRGHQGPLAQVVNVTNGGASTVARFSRAGSGGARRGYPTPSRWTEGGSDVSASTVTSSKPRSGRAAGLGAERWSDELDPVLAGGRRERAGLFEAWAALGAWAARPLGRAAEARTKRSKSPRVVTTSQRAPSATRRGRMRHALGGEDRFAGSERHVRVPARTRSSPSRT